MRWLRNEALTTDSSPGLPWLARGLGRRGASRTSLEREFGLPYHVAVIAHAAAQSDAAIDEGVEPDDESTFLASLPFYSLCRGLLMPVAGMTPEKAAQLFGLQIPAPPALQDREALFQRFLEQDVGLTRRQKIACLVGDPFEGGKQSLPSRELAAFAPDHAPGRAA